MNNKKLIVDRGLEKIFTYLNEKRNLDFSTNRFSMIERRINKRLLATGNIEYSEYFKYLNTHQEEMDQLIDVLTINLSRFFRNPLTFEYLAEVVLPKIILQKKKASNNSFRVWSAGCARGEEVYSVAILLKELMKKGKYELDTNIFATDIDEQTLENGRTGVYASESIMEVKQGLLNKYFIRENETYHLKSEIKDMVDFSFFDILNTKTYVPPESIYGNFDLVLCRNLLIYFQPVSQEIIFDKLFKSLSKGGFLVLGEAEKLPQKYMGSFYTENDYCRIFHKYR